MDTRMFLSLAYGWINKINVYLYTEITKVLCRKALVILRRRKNTLLGERCRFPMCLGKHAVDYL